MTYPSSPSACEARFTMLPRMQDARLTKVFRLRQFIGMRVNRNWLRREGLLRNSQKALFPIDAMTGHLHDFDRRWSILEIGPHAHVS